MKYHENIAARAKENALFRKVEVTGTHCQVVLISIPPGGEIGEEVHAGHDQVLVFVQGSGEEVLADERAPVAEGDLVLVPDGMKHNFVNTGTEDLRLYTLYAPPEHAPDTVHATKADADAAEGHA
jgi:mannose-6-phosphate isomerase-like protein (cupin superfamily)